ncbi:unnamed protein product [Musa acuminata subsp. burmannicoides]
MVGDRRRADIGGLGLVKERRVADGGDDDDEEAGDRAVRHLVSLVQHFVGGAILSLSLSLSVIDICHGAGFLARLILKAQRWERLLKEKNEHWGLISGFAKMSWNGQIHQPLNGVLWCSPSMSFNYKT